MPYMLEKVTQAGNGDQGMKRRQTEYKYLILHAVVSGLDMDFPFIFPKTLIHQYVAVVMRPLIKASFPKIKDINEITVRSAGTITFGDIACEGKSESLGVSAGEHDSDIIEVNPYTGGIDDNGHTLILIREAVLLHNKSKRTRPSELVCLHSRMRRQFAVLRHHKQSSAPSASA
jgi:hypothetical protein